MITPRIEMLMETLRTDRTPRDWIKYARSHTTYLATHIKNFSDDYLWFQLQMETDGMLQTVRLAAFRNPHSILIAIKSIFAKENNVAMEMIAFNNIIAEYDR